MKSVRFSIVVARSGKPEPYTLWSDPKKDPEFQRAVKASRVMSVHQESVGSKADYGTVGFKGDRQAQLLVFPKSLKPFDGRRVVGVKYDMLDQPPAAPKSEKPLQKLAPRKPSPVKPTKPKAAKPKASEKKIVEFPRSHVPPAKPNRQKSLSPLRPLLRRAIKALEAGKAVKAHQLLQQLDREMQ